MKIVSKHTVLANNGDTLTDQHLGEYLGKSVKKLGVYASMNPELSLTAITDSLFNIYEGVNTKGKRIGHTPINSMTFEWDIDVNYIHKVKIVGTVASGTHNVDDVFNMYLAEKYYFQNDIFKLENRQQLRVVAPPKMVSTTKWLYKVQLMADNTTTAVDNNYLVAGLTTLYNSNAYPEMSERGYTKFIASTESHRNYLTRHRHSVAWSQQFAANGDVYFEAKEGKNTVYYKALQKEKNLLDEFMLTREQANLTGVSNHDLYGKCLHQDDDGQDVPAGDGLIPQAEKYASRTYYSVFTTGVARTVIKALTDKCKTITGNTLVVMSNKLLYNSFQDAILDDDRLKQSNSSFLYSMDKGDVKIGNTFASYEYGGNKIVFAPNTALTQEFPDKGYGIILDLTKDITTGKPAVATFTLEGGEMITGTMEGLGGADGKTSGKVSTGITGSQYHIYGTSGIGFFKPYASHLIIEN